MNYAVEFCSPLFNSDVWVFEVNNNAREFNYMNLSASLHEFHSFHKLVKPTLVHETTTNGIFNHSNHTKRPSASALIEMKNSLIEFFPKCSHDDISRIEMDAIAKVCRFQSQTVPGIDVEIKVFLNKNFIYRARVTDAISSCCRVNNAQNLKLIQRN